MILAVLLGLQQADPAPAPAPATAKLPALRALAPSSDPRSWIGDGDYPPAALRQGISGTVAFRLWVDAEGAVSRCEIVASAGPVLDETTCALLTARARFIPALDSTGQPMAATYASRMIWSLPEPALRAARSLTPRTPPPTWVTSSDYPDKALNGRGFGRVRFRLYVDGSGEVTACHILATSGYWLLDEETCSILRNRARFVPALDAGGTPVASSFTSAFTWDRGDKGLGQWDSLMKAVGEPVSVSVAVRKLPASYRQASLVRIRFDQMGKPVECRLELTSGSAAIDRAACAQGMAGAKPAPSTPLLGDLDARMFLVEFKAEPGLAGHDVPPGVSAISIGERNPVADGQG